MRYLASKRFEKDFVRLPKGVKAKALVAFEKFVQNPVDPTLRVHELSGAFKGHFSIDITGDIRAIYFLVEKDVAHFVAIGSHSKLYG